MEKSLTDFEKCKKLLKSLGVTGYKIIDYSKEKYHSDGFAIDIGDDCGKLTFNGFCSVSIDFNSDGSLKQIDIWGD